MFSVLHQFYSLAKCDVLFKIHLIMTSFDITQNMCHCCKYNVSGHSAESVGTSEAADFDRVERSSLQAGISGVDWALPFAQTTGELELVSGEDVTYQVAQQPPAILLGGVDGLVPLFIGDEERVVLQELFTALWRRGGIK